MGRDIEVLLSGFEYGIGLGIVGFGGGAERWKIDGSWLDDLMRKVKTPLNRLDSLFLGFLRQHLGDSCGQTELSHASQRPIIFRNVPSTLKTAPNPPKTSNAGLSNQHVA